MLYASSQRTGRISNTISTVTIPGRAASAYFLLTFVNSALVVLSIDLIKTLSFGVIGELACFRGLKFKMAERTLLAMEGRARMRRPRQLSVELTSTASLKYISSISLPSGRLTHHVFSWKTFNRRSRSPEASASRLGGGISWCVRGTSAREVSLCSGRYSYNQSQVLVQAKEGLFKTHSWVVYQAWGLHQDHLLYEFDAADTHPSRSRIPHA